MKKRFIAGVTCPKCGALDTIVAVNNEEEKALIRECVACGFTDRISTQVNSPKELDTRVSPQKSEDEAPVQIVKIIE
ncbi:YheV family putative zinc ribbon protein [Reinekea marinisedimentorum]|uniref:Uncharacterized protein n=1 Tax=Reinekea marinisedimentorum TaxID=230495 RepID=A0A4V2UKC4_9GAMM|nr:YheV family putative zinc ribbon protein [Reinekea marinisedimentorum]TCS43843.1 hypothetical protein BCF53_101186 [Reinekea marinisedimentorum]